jgi:hypothetical protein
MPLNDTVILITKKGMGHGPEELQLILLDKYLQLLGKNDEIPSVMCFYTEGVRLVTEPSSLLDQLISLEKRGVRLIACSTCLAYYGLIEKVKAGIAGSMADILEAQLRAAKVISL